MKWAESPHHFFQIICCTLGLTENVKDNNLSYETWQADEEIFLQHNIFSLPGVYLTQDPTENRLNWLEIINGKYVALLITDFNPKHWT